MRLQPLVETSRRVGATGGRTEKQRLLAGLLRRVPADEIEIAIGLLSGVPRQGRIGVGPATVRAARPDGAAAGPALTLADVDRALHEIKTISGKGSEQRRLEALRRLLGAATADEQDFLMRLMLGELRQGALEALLVEATARAAGVDAAALRRAVMVAGRLGPVAAALFREGGAALARFDIEPFRPIQPMLAQTVEDVADALAQLGEAAFEYKLDGARVQVHKAGDEVRVYSRRLREVTGAVPELVESVRAFPAKELILDGEVLALRKDGRPHPFQTTMRRFGRREDVARLREKLPLSTFFFDLLYLESESLLDAPAGERFAAMDRALPAKFVIPRCVTATRDEAQTFLQEAHARGHEGVMAKSLTAPYAAGSRGASWLKLKPVHTLDLVILAAEWGNGRRRGWLSNLHLGARDPDGGYVMLGKTFKGLTDKMLEWQTERLQALATRREGHVVHVWPEIVVEIAFNDVQRSPQYPASMALRFARVKAYRPDKGPGDADTIEDVREIYRRATGTEP